MIIIDINHKEREIDPTSLKVIKHKVPAIGPNAKEGETITVKFVEVKIIPKSVGRSEWKEWYPLDEFKELNPMIKL